MSPPEPPSVEHSTQQQNALFSNVHETFFRIDHRLGHIASLKKFKRIEIIQCVLSNHNGVKLEINNRNLGNPQVSGN